MFDFPSFVVAAFPSVVVVIGGVVVGSARALSPSALHSLALALCHFPIFCVQFLCVTVIFGMGALNLFGKRVLNRGRKLVNGRLCLSQSVLNIVIYLT